jgi:Protein of unknown function (DUF3431)
VHCRALQTFCQTCADLTATNASGAEAEGCYPYLASGKGSEGSAYLQFIIDEYDNGLPQSTMFLHGHWYVALTKHKLPSRLQHQSYGTHADTVTHRMQDLSGCPQDVVSIMVDNLAGSPGTALPAMISFPS